MGKIIILYFILLPNILLGQYHIKTQKRLNYLEDSKEIVLFKVIVKNMSKDTILIPNKNCLLKKRYTQGFDDVSFELFSSGKNDSLKCEYLVSPSLSLHLKKIPPFKSGFFNVVSPVDCFISHRRYWISLFFYIGVNNSMTEAVSYCEQKTKMISFIIQ